MTLELKQSQAHREQMAREITEDGVMLEKLRDEVDRLKSQNEKIREAVIKCLDHWAIVAGPSAYERSVMRILLENALEGSCPANEFQDTPKTTGNGIRAHVYPTNRE